MVLEETFQFAAILIVTLVFSVVSLLDLEYRLLLKVVAGCCWFVLALTQVYYFGGGQLLAVPLMFLFLGLGMVYCFSIVSDFRQKKRDEVYSFISE
ncbi:MAG: hypothetical protein WC325_10075 [Candidatus Bathyarchaeia archaeon]|jgi:uncharacterized membrane protein